MTKPIIATWGDNEPPADLDEVGRLGFDLHRNRWFSRPPGCPVCGTRSWRIRSRNGGPWELQCGNAHAWERRTSDTVIIEFPDA